ncbi:hypothetical protein C1645_875931 [Glomus cerebriforme]|uniref:F-box domain-containing protein n=1 Tax=Glomus cerebriforme TaxID=658196 RepID=A0A397T093_9GLOM|nr:hypothetical protein C1645_875931 [Glomus cerebriforme]
MSITNSIQNENKKPLHIPSDVIEEILFFIQEDDLETLHSCSLINRQWCQLVIPKLWKHPFYYAQKGNSKLISLILSFLKDIQKESLIYNGIILSSTTTFNSNYRSKFNYISMIKHLHYDFMLISVEEWCKQLTFAPVNVVSLIIKIILKLFIDNSVKLNSLFIWPSHVRWRHYNLNRYIELVEPEFNGLIENLKFLHVETHSHYPSANFIQKLSLIVRNVEILHLRTPLLGLMRFPNSMEDNMAKSLCTLIQSQNNLKEFKLVNSIRYTSSFIASLSIHTNNLKSIILFDTKIDEIDTWKTLTNCFNLENFEIINCVGLHDEFILPFNNIINWKKLKWISIEKNQPSDVNDELKLWIINRYKKGLNDYGFGKLFDNFINVSKGNENGDIIIK